MINGYSDILTPFLGLAGGNAGATGWWSNLRIFSKDNFLPERTGGGRLPIVRYLSVLLLNRIMHTERDAFSVFVPDVINNFARDRDYSPDRGVEALQSWEALRQILDDLVLDDMGEAMEKATDALGRASEAYTVLKQQVDIDPKSNDDHIEAIEEGMKLFRLRAEI